MNSSCPSCDTPLSRGARSCSCGWTIPGVSKQKPMGYDQCEWSSDNHRCRYPGSMSTNMHGTGPWYCRMHYGCKDPIFGAQIVQASMDYRHPSPEEIDADARQKSTDYCKKIGMTRREGESEQAYAIRRKAWLKERFQTAMKVAA